MLIRCDKCTTVYELDETLLPAQGAPVQCSKCQFVFTAFPPPPAPAGKPAPPPAPEARPEDEEPPEDEPVPADLMPGGAGAADVDAPPAASAATTACATEPPSHALADDREASPPPDSGGDSEPDRLREAPAEPERGVPPSAPPSDDGVVAPPRVASRAGTAPRFPPGRHAPSGAGQAPPSAPQFTPDGRPIRKVPFPTEEPQPGRELPGLKPPKGGVRVDAGRRPKGWVILVAVVALLALVFVGWRLFARRTDGTPAAPRPVGAVEPARSPERQVAGEPSGVTAPAPPPATSPERAGEPDRRARGKVLPSHPPATASRNATKP